MKNDIKEEKKAKVKREPYVQTKVRADGSKEVYLTKSPQHTVAGKIIVIILAILLGGSSIIGLIFALCQM